MPAPMSLAQFRYRGELITLPICFAEDRLAEVLEKHFADGVIDWDAVQKLPHVFSTPAQRAELESKLARRHAELQVWRPRDAARSAPK